MVRTNIAIRGQLVLEAHASDRYRRHRTGSIVTGQLGIRGLLLRTGVVATGQLGLRDTLFRTGIIVT